MIEQKKISIIIYKYISNELKLIHLQCIYSVFTYISKCVTLGGGANETTHVPS